MRFLKVKKTVGNSFTHLCVMKYPHDCGIAGFGFLDERDDRFPVSGIERSRRFIKKKYWKRRDKAARDIDPLLFAAREGGRRQMPKAFRNIEAGKKVLGGRPRLFGIDTALPRTFRYDVDCRNPGNDAKKLGDVTDGPSSDFDDLPGLRRDNVNFTIVMLHQHRASLKLVVGI